MPLLRNNAVPSYRLHKQSGQAIVTLNGRDVLLGAYGSAASKAAYDRGIAEWIANGRQLSVPRFGLSLSQLIERYRQHVEAYYRRPDGSPTSEADNIRQAIRPVRKLYGSTLAVEFSPLKLKAVRDQMVNGIEGRSGYVRASINKRINRIRAMFKWAVENEILPPSVHQGLMAVSALKAGRTAAPEGQPVRPVPEDYICPILDHVSPQVRAMVELQLLTGARPGEICSMRTIDIDRGGRVWIFRPESHKTQYRGHSREIRIGPKAQEVLKPFLNNLDLTAYVFSPRDAELARRSRMHAKRKTPLGYGNRPGSNRRRNPKWQPGAKYTVNSYRRAVQRACDVVFSLPSQLCRIRVDGKRPDTKRWETENEWRTRIGTHGLAEAKAWIKEHRWHTHQLRHNAATRLRREYGVEMARIILGHQHVSATEIYAEADAAKAMEVMAEVG